MIYLTKIIQPLGPALAIPSSKKMEAFHEARKYQGNLVRVYAGGKLIAEKPAGSDRLDHIKTGE